MNTGTVPILVFWPTVHFHATRPLALALLSPRPCAVEAPESYSTSMSHRAPWAVVTVVEAVAPLATAPGAFVTLTGNAGTAGGVDAGGVDAGGVDARRVEAGGWQAGAADAGFPVAVGAAVARPLEGPTQWQPRRWTAGIARRRPPAACNQDERDCK